MTETANLRVLHIGSGRYRVGDRSHVTYSIWSELAKGFREYHVVARSLGAAGSWREGNLEINLLPSWSACEAEFLLTQFLALRKGVARKPDVIVCQSPSAGGPVGAIIAKLTDARLLTELHSDIYFCDARLASKNWLCQEITRLVLPLSDALRVLSPTMQQALGRKYGHKAFLKSRVVAPRVELSLFEPSPRKTPARRALQLIMVGSVTARKGQLRLIEALKTISFPIVLRIIGDGPDLSDCRAKAARTGNLQVRCEGAVPIAELPKWLQRSDIFVLYSNSEGTPRAMMEAMAMGLPVITTNAGFCSDLVDHNVEGVVLGDDPDFEIVDVLARFHTDRGLMRSMGAAARERACRDYDSVKLFDDYRRLISDTAAS